VLGKLFSDGLAQRPCPFTMNYPDLVQTSHKGVIQVSVKLEQCLIYGKSAQMQLVCWRHIL